MGVLLLDTLNDHGADVELSLPSLGRSLTASRQPFSRRPRTPIALQIDAQDYIYDVLIATITCPA